MLRALLLVLVTLLTACGREVEVPSSPAQTGAPAPASGERATDVLPPNQLEPAERYVERDLATFWMPLPGDAKLYMAWADSVLLEDPSQFEHRLNRAFQRAKAGQTDDAEADFRYLLERSDLNPFQLRRVQWNYGWALFETDKPADALRYWQQAEQGQGGRPDWVPLTYALALWRLGENERALAFYNAATRTDPRLTTAEGLAQRVQYWESLPKQTAEAVFAAWQSRGGDRE